MNSSTLVFTLRALLHNTTLSTRPGKAHHRASQAVQHRTGNITFPGMMGNSAPDWEQHITGHHTQAVQHWSGNITFPGITGNSIGRAFSSLATGCIYNPLHKSSTGPAVLGSGSSQGRSTPTWTTWRGSFFPNYLTAKPHAALIFPTPVVISFTYYQSANFPGKPQRWHLMTVFLVY